MTRSIRLSRLLLSELLLNNSLKDFDQVVIKPITKDTPAKNNLDINPDILGDVLQTKNKDLPEKNEVNNPEELINQKPRISDLKTAVESDDESILYVDEGESDAEETKVVSAHRSQPRTNLNKSIHQCIVSANSSPVKSPKTRKRIKNTTKRLWETANEETKQSEESFRQQSQRKTNQH